MHVSSNTPESSKYGYQNSQYPSQGILRAREAAFLKRPRLGQTGPKGQENALFKKVKAGPNWPKEPVSRFFKGPGKGKTGQKGQSAGFEKASERAKLAKRASQPVF